MPSWSDIEVNLLLEASGGGTAKHVFELFQGMQSLNVPAKLIVSPIRLDPVSEVLLSTLDSHFVMKLPMQREPHISDGKVLATLRAYFSESKKRHVLHAHSTKAGLIASLLKGSVVGNILTQHAFRSVDPNMGSIEAKLVSAVESWYSRRFDTFIGVSKSECHYAAKLGVPEQNIRFIPNGIEVDEIAEKASKSRQSRKPGPTIGFVGRLAYQKHPELFLETLHKIAGFLDGVSAIVVGDGPLMPTLKSYADTLGLSSRIQWRGNVDATTVLGEMDLLIHTSRYESMPYALMEAAAACVPVAAVRNDGSEALFGSVAPNYLASNGTSSGLCDQALMLLRHSELSAQCAANALQMVRQLSTESMVKRIVAEYEAIFLKREKRKFPNPSPLHDIQEWKQGA